MAAKLLPLVLRVAIVGLLAVTQVGAAVQVTVEQGVLLGTKAKTHDGNAFYAFKGVPFAAPPVEKLRFKEPAEPEKWDGVRDATKDNPICIQRDVLFSKSKEIIGQEDCLYLNVFTPKVPRKGDNATGLLPVLVFFHGGGWLCGNAGIYGPQYLLDRDIILVVPNFRLGPLGFLSTEDAVCPGNFGLKDQVAALRWVRDNIAAFGGNKGAVTIAGESAGGASVHYHMVSPLARGLFNNAISMSGTMFAHWAFSPTPMVQTKKLAIAHGCPFDDSEELVACLSKKDAKEIIDKQDRLYDWGIDPILPFRPSIEPMHGGQNYMPASREEMIRETERDMENAIPWIAGFTSEDGAIKTASLASDPALMAELERDFSTVGPLTLNFTADDPAAVAMKIKDFYLGADGKFAKENFDKITRMYTDRQFVVPLVYSISTMKAFSTHRSIYLYQFGYKGNHSMSKAFDPNSSTNYGVVHMDELQYIFSMPQFFPAVPKSPKKSDTKMMKYMTKLIVDFATEGYPTPTKITFGETHDANDLEWYAIGQVFPLEIADISSPKPEGYLAKTKHFQEAVAFWKSLGLNEGGSKDYIDNGVGVRDEL